MIERIPHCIGHGLGPFLECLPRTVHSARDELLRNAVCTHCTPLVMVSGMAVDQPELRDVTELYVLSYLLRVQVAVVVYDGHGLGMAMVQLSGSLCREKEVFVDE